MIVFPFDPLGPVERGNRIIQAATLPMFVRDVAKPCEQHKWEQILDILRSMDNANRVQKSRVFRVDSDDTPLPVRLRRLGPECQ
jgi:hypothetical protein